MLQARQDLYLRLTPSPPQDTSDGPRGRGSSAAWRGSLSTRQSSCLGSIVGARGLAPRTVETYMFALEGLREFLAQRCDPPELPQTRDLRAYIAHMLDRSLSRGTIRVRMRSIRGLL
ncbi:MAG: hypothetical protein DRP27_08650 [Thermotogae bacterium]|nr:MAG: hypothetical protein DRP27_08650 [Thermotogota bacterium]